MLERKQNAKKILCNCVEGPANQLLISFIQLLVVVLSVLFCVCDSDPYQAASQELHNQT